MMPARFNLYSAWIDPFFYVWALVFAGALFALVYSIRRYLELKNAPETEEEGLEPAVAVGAEAPAAVEVPAAAAALPEAADEGEKTLVVPPPFQPEFSEAQPAAEEYAAEQPQAYEEPVQRQDETPYAGQAAEARPPQDFNRAENFVRGIYEGISDLDERMKGIEDALSKSRVNNDFTVKFLEDVLQDFDTLEKEKIRARIEYLLSDLKK
ncbi:MAG: hypothetical protein M0025_04000 [Elusimicrobia bacterium]|nr:hypothetical protein [Elusimicrobiota bacterium]